MKSMVRSLVLAVAAPLVLFGCADLDAPTALPSAPIFSTSSTSPDLSKLARYGKKQSITIAWAKKWIGPEGGRLDFQGFAIEVPAGAVSEVTKFEIRLPVDPSGSERVVAEFSPHGATFAQPVTIEFPYAGTSLQGSASATIVWWNDVWVDMGATVTGDGTRLRTTTKHFSTYGTTDERAGGGVVVAGG
jgi:hypothetical protein